MKKEKIFKYISFGFVILLGFKMQVFALKCTDLGEIKIDLQNVFNFIKIILPLLIIGLSSVDFIKAITAKDDKDVKKAFSKLIKRLVLAVVFFFLPILINVLLDLFMINSSVCVN